MMTPGNRPPTPTLRQRRAPVRARAANDCGEPAGVGVMLIAVANATTVRRELGFTGWGGAFVSFVSRLKQISGGGRISHFAWDTVCLVFDAVSPDAFSASFEAVVAAKDAETRDASDALMFDFVAGAALGNDEVDALERAEQALTDARLRGHSLLAPRDRTERIQSVIDLAGDLALAVQRDELFLVYQPKLHLRQRRIASAEVLIRWQHPLLGLVMPDAFIGLADDSGEMRAITLWTLQRVIADQRRLANAGHRLRIFVNISGGLLTDRVFIDAACALVEAGGVEIGFEITETSVIRDPDLAIANLERCAAIGITLAIDDYGSGLSSLSYLKRLPATELKIDKMFVTQLTSSHRDPLIVRSTIDLAHALDMEVTAEGVETPAALALLTVMGCEMVQGYLISAPLELGAFVSFLSDYRFEAHQTHAEPTVNRPASFWKRA